MLLAVGHARAERGAEDGLGNSLSPFAIIDEVEPVVHVGRVGIALVGIGHLDVDLGKQHVEPVVAQHGGHHGQHAAHEVVGLVGLADQRPDADGLAAHLVVLVVGHEDRAVAHAVVVVGGLGHQAVDLGYLALQSQLADERRPRHGVLALGRGLGQVARVGEQSRQQDPGRLVVDGHAQLVVALEDDGAGGADHLAAHVRDAAVLDVALHVVVNLLQDLGLPGAVHALGVVGVVGQYKSRLRNH